MTNVINTSVYTAPVGSAPVFFDDYSQLFYYMLNGQSIQINQNTEFEEPVLNQDDLAKLFEMIDDWEKGKYPERFL